MNSAKFRLSALRCTRTTFVQILGTPAVFAGHLARSRTLQQYLSPAESSESSPFHGAIYSGRWGKTAWCWWAPDFRLRKLFIGQMVTSRIQGMQKPIAKLLHLAVAEACALGLKEVVMWQPTADVREAAGMLADELGAGVQALFKERIENIPCVRLHEQNKREVSLVEPQFYAWW
ncbi:uncharacterized protein MAM_07910 [Metarhizium album ARSEF 1941]|uniref:LYC1 C-terminal domain-containing protein n=1 Tax=Metarhizium album (strain ARSEF 1941) TaxID=1081103 RepID=A0A0B2WKV5_METAS|nr:uncharacterized protein MAM_07910 [Metarhizium album ARSEF 1941]KHN94274.1 hypothetical protein MAM_07910 [Metarhizium album ARSEF 1941]